jgi:hypothetical protein
MKATLKPLTLSTTAAPFAIRAKRASDIAARVALFDACFGTNRAHWRHTRLDLALQV